MLIQLNIKNFALIENLSIEFDHGFNVLSGQTGSGKSILIDAINFVLGNKFNKNLIRTGENKTFVEAIFTINNDNIKEVLNKCDINSEDLIIISRETFRSGKSIAKVNGKSMLLAQVKLISEKLLDIHGQHENQNLLDSAKHIFYLDDFGYDKMNKLLEEYKVNYYQALSIENKISELEVNESERQKRLEFIKYQIDDINKAGLKVGEDIELEEKFSLLSNAEKLDKTLSLCYNTLYNGESESFSVFDSLNLVLRNLRNSESFSEKIKAVADSIEESYYNIEQNIHDISDLKSNIYYDKNELDYINERIYLMDNYKKKYGDTIDEILTYKGEIEQEYLELSNSNEVIEELVLQKEKIHKKMNAQAEELHTIRCDIAVELEKKIKSELDYIGLEKSNIKINIEFSESFNEKGKNKVQFLISTNPGEPLKPLETVVSGGELSRIMLALKTVFFDKDNIPTVIFDEIDTGISGRIAQSVAEKMYLISNKHQVFCVTHLPQIASMSDNNYLVRKDVIDSKTYTFVKKMTDKEKQFEIARMIGGSQVTDLTLEHSKEMLKLAQDRKIKIS